MTTLVNHGRQYALAAVQKVNFDDVTTAGLSAIQIELPPGAIVLRGSLDVTTPSNASGAGTLSVGLSGGSATAFLAATDLKTAANTAFTGGAGMYLPNGGKITLTSAANTTATAGVAYVIVEYVVVGRGNEVQD